MVGRRDGTLLVTGGAGFIGSHLTDLALARGHRVVVLDALTYAGSLDNLEAARRQPGFTFVKGDIGDRALAEELLAAHGVHRVFHLAAESHVDNSITGPEPFLRTNVDGTFRLLEACRAVWERRSRPDGFRFVHVSTDEVFGDLGPDDPPFHEARPTGRVLPTPPPRRRATCSPARGFAPSGCRWSSRTARTILDRVSTPRS